MNLKFSILEVEDVHTRYTRMNLLLVYLVKQKKTKQPQIDNRTIVRLLDIYFILFFFPSDSKRRQCEKVICKLYVQNSNLIDCFLLFVCECSR